MAIQFLDRQWFDKALPNLPLPRLRYTLAIDRGFKDVVAAVFHAAATK